MVVRMLDLQELEVFLIAAEAGNFSEAGRILHLSQPAVSRIIQHLEERFALHLFERNGRGVRLSDAGQAVLPMVRELVLMARRVEENIAQFQDRVVGRVMIGCNTTAGKYLLPGLIGRFRQKYPQVYVDVMYSSQDVVFAKLHETEIDFVLTSHKPDDYSDLTYLPVYMDEVVLVVSRSHPWAHHGVIYPDDLLDVPIIMRENDSATAKTILNSLQQHDIAPEMLHVEMTLGSSEAIAIAVEDGLGVGFVSRLVALRAHAHNRLAMVSIEGLDLRHELFFVRNRRVPMTPSKAALWEFAPRDIEQMQVNTDQTHKG
ncbi:MAG: LysR family transcriptional regulator [Chloroflexi bacterium]|nr:MAG: LysR family transcriptional regulator [Chloroflexota bacterium]